MYRESNNIIETINIPLVVPAKTGIYQTFLSWKIPEIRFIDSAGSRLSTGSSSHFSCTGVPACTFCHSLSPLSFPRKRESWARRRNTFDLKSKCTSNRRLKLSKVCYCVCPLRSLVFFVLKLSFAFGHWNLEFPFVYCLLTKSSFSTLYNTK